jgi:hypothetical protein
VAEPGTLPEMKASSKKKKNAHKGMIRFKGDFLDPRATLRGGKLQPGLLTSISTSHADEK